MPNDVIFAMTQRHRVFDGTNAADMLAAVDANFSGASISASANYPGASATLAVEAYPGYTVNFAVGDSWNSTTGGQYPAASLADTSFAVPLAQFIRDTAPAPALAVGYAPTPSIAGGDSETVTVPMVPALPDDGYNVSIALAGASQLLGSLQVIGHDVISASAVDVTVRNNGILALGGATVLVTALHNG